MEHLLQQFGGNPEAAMRFAQDLMNQQPKPDEDEQELDQDEITALAKQSYDIFISNALEATSHTVQWLPISQEDPEYSNFTSEHFLIGTHHDEESPAFGNDKLMVVKVRVPKYSKNEKNVIDYSRLPQDCSQIQVVKTWDHEGEVNKARYNPNDKNMVASLMTSGEVNIYMMNENKPVASLRGLEQDGFGLSWNPKQQGLIVAATGQQVVMWDLNKNGQTILKVDDAHQNTINDVKFSPLNPNLFITASDDSHYKVWDVKSGAFIQCYKASEDDLLTATFNQMNEHLFATGGEQSGMINIWDLRMPKHFLNDLNYHKATVTQLEWSPFHEQLLMSASQDKKVYVWDNNKVGEEQARHDYEDGPPELIFPHTTHLANVEDIAWSPFQEHFVVSTDTSMNMQIWKMSQEFFDQETDYLEKLDRIKDTDLE